MRVELAPIRLWRHDLAGPLHAATGVLLGFRSVDPLEVLGASWSFAFIPGGVGLDDLATRSDSVLATLALHCPLSTRWHRDADPDRAWRDVRARLAAGTAVALVVDERRLPFGRAYRDVHTSHLVVAYGFDDEAELAYVADPVPPRFQGSLALPALAAARDAEHGHPWLEIELEGRPRAFEPTLVREVLERNLRRFRATNGDGPFASLEGERRFLGETIDAVAGGRAPTGEAIVAVEGALAASALHADYLALAARRFDDASLAEAGRAVERVAHHWAALRVALDESGADAEAPPLRRRAVALLRDHELALGRVARAAERL